MSDKPDCVHDEQPGYLKCKHGGWFPYTPKRGRPPTICPWHREHEAKAKVRQRKEKQEARVVGGLTAVPVFERVKGIEDIRKGMIVYNADSSIFTNDISRRLYAKDYLVTDVDVENGVLFLQRNAVGRKNDTIPVKDVERLSVKTGVEYMKIEANDFFGGVEEEDND